MSEAPSGGTGAKWNELCECNACGGPASAAARSGTTASFRPSGFRAPPFAEVSGCLRLRALRPQRTAAHPRAAAAKFAYKSFSCGLACAAAVLPACECLLLQCSYYETAAKGNVCKSVGRCSLSVPQREAAAPPDAASVTPTRGYTLRRCRLFAFSTKHLITA